VPEMKCNGKKAVLFLRHHWGLLLQGGILLFWIVMMGCLVQKSVFEPRELPAVPGLAKETMKAGENWWEIHLQKEKIGIGSTVRKAQGDKFTVQEQLWMKMTVMGQPQNAEQTLDYQIDQNLVLESFQYALRSGPVEMRIAGRLRNDPGGSGKILSLIIHSAGREEKQELRLAETPHIIGQTRLQFVSQGLERGRKYRISAFDPSSFSVAEMIAEVEGEERLRVGGEERALLRVREEFRGIQVRSWIDRDGEVWREESPLGMVLLRTDKETAIHKNWRAGTGLDVTELSAVPADREIASPRTLDYLKVRLHSAALTDVTLAGDRQSWNGDVLVVRKEDFPPKTPASPGPSRQAMQEYLRPTALIQSQDPEIQRTAAEIVGDAKDPAEKVRRITAWVFKAIDKKPVFSIPSAVEVLRQKVGDCNEHAVLFTALARAAGVPAQMLVGIMYLNGKFYYHAWVRAYLGSWVTVDPTLNQIPADATHICLIEGDLDRQLEVIKFIGRLRIEILEVR
jgi:hypothetical protein